MATATAPVGLLLRVPLSGAVLEQYRREASEYGVELEELLANRLTECVTYKAAKPLYFDDAQRQELERTIGRNFTNTQNCLDLVKRALTLKVNGLSVTLKPDVLARLRTRQNAGEFADWLTKQIHIWAEAFVGLR